MQIRGDLTGQVHDTVESLDVDLVGRPEHGVLIQQRAHLGRDARIAGASLEAALAVCVVRRASGESGRLDDDQREHRKQLRAIHAIGVRAEEER